MQPPRIHAADEAALAELDINVVGQLGKGHFGSVLLGEQADGTQVAIKVAQRLDREAATLQTMQGDVGFPSLLHYRERGGGKSRNDLLVMERLGPSLQDLWEKDGRGAPYFSAPKLLKIGRDALGCLRRMHLAGVLHNDIKPANLVLGAEGSGREGNLCLIDFGISTRTHESETGCCNVADAEGELPEVCKLPVEPVSTYDSDLKMYVQAMGTPTFASIREHERSETRPVDDVESLFYSLAFLAAGGLPWASRNGPDRGPDAQALQWKRTLMERGLDDGLWDCEAAAQLQLANGEGGRPSSPELAEALRGVWAEVMACHASGAEVDYEACLAALHD